ncbi:hypothetical protein K7432_004954 [Basidiobolus ranarum]|uniref:Uncharacterized protein n=1 Tax=Basidiobolus ranarum TaxID=34480 RepID=A0ABR2WXD9_9FUNG
MLVVQSLPIVPSMSLVSSSNSRSDCRTIALSPHCTPFSTALPTKSDNLGKLPLDREIPAFAFRRRNAVVEANYGEPFQSTN